MAIAAARTAPTQYQPAEAIARKTRAGHWKRQVGDFFTGLPAVALASSNSRIGPRLTVVPPMPRIVLKDLDTEKAQSVPETEAVIGRDPACAFVIEGQKSKVVSSRHARIFFQDNSWWIEDTSRNGTILDDERLQVGQRHALRVGQVIGLGESGPRLRVSALESRQMMATVIEPPDLDRQDPAPGKEKEKPSEPVKPTTAPRQSAGAAAPATPGAFPDI